ncbi:murein biosynthesis integral membrane protein MurJ [Hydrogenimonas cancrithermarum]|uniref:Probable lipid II flippase MurJ n=1 Tax=Hydrogenimonas cancrithermarum TaxID=2993563 RepID=A0ABM8FHZ2_9BACT|nr:murein biosynthesis integral membrane protein MurJ [Hydrogenimonas cancrithermarum]BDY11866.1 putative lipid II flippase MurJ [Hydrogenimonas cancrithermarum]
MRFRSIFTTSAGILTSRIFGFIRDLLMASILGANIFSDIFFVAFKLPNLFRRIFAEGAFVQSFMPTFILSRHRSVFAVAILIRFFLFLLIASLFVTLFSEIVTRLIAIGFSKEAVRAAAPLVAINFYYLDFIFLVTFLSALLQYKEHFATTAFGTTLLNISMITALVLFRHDDPETIVYALSFAVLAGGALQLLLHLWMIRRKGLDKLLVGGFKYLKRKKDAVKEDIDRFSRAFFPSVLGNSTAQISSFIDTWLASFLVSGSISYLFYANRLFQLPLALFATAASTALFPTISKLLKQERFDDAKAQTRRVFWLLVAMLGGASAIALILSEEMVELLFERGAFNAEDTKDTAMVLRMYIAGLLPFGIAKLFSLWLYATHRQGDAAKIAAKSLGVNILFSLLLISPMAAPGLALASSISGWVLLALTLKAVGHGIFLDIMRSKYAPYALLFIGAATLLSWGLKVAIHDYL